MPLTAGLGTGGSRPGVCTSTTRPASPFEGQIIYETDTDVFRVYNETGWISLNPVNTNRNKIINGGFDVWQRSTSATTTGSDAYASADRWRSRTAAGAGSMTVSRQNPSLTGFRYCARVQRVNGNTNTDALQFIQTAETSNSIPLAGNPVTLSFYARKGANYSPTGSALKAILASGTGTDQYWLSFTGGATVINQTATLTDSWQRFSYTATPASTATQFYVAFEMNPTGTASTNDWYEVTGVQLEPGSVATPFEFEDIGTTEQKCFRYFYRHAPTGGISYLSFVYAGSQQRLTLPLPVPMRANPSSVTSSGWAGGNSPTVTTLNKDAINFFHPSGAYYIESNTTVIDVNAEL